MKKDDAEAAVFQALEVSKFRLVAGITIGIPTSISFYGFLYVVRETLRYFTITPAFDIWVMSDKEVNFYNLFFAFVAVIYGHAVCINYWIDSPRRYREDTYRKRGRIINEQRVLNWVFLLWFFRLATLLGFLYGFSFKGWFNAFKIYPRYNYLFIIIVVVLYLNMWNSVRHLFKRKTVRWGLVSMVTTLVLSWGLSKINVIDYKSINESVLTKSVYDKNTLEIPRSAYAEKLQNLSLKRTLYVARSKETGKAVYWADGEEIV